MLTIIRIILNRLWPDDPEIKKERLYLIFSAGLLAAAWPPFPLGFLAFVALVLPLDLLSRRNFGDAFKGGFLFSFSFHLFSVYWISWVTLPGMIAAVALISLYDAILFGLFARIRNRFRLLSLLIFPILWAGVEYFRTQTEVAFPWSNLSYTQGSYIPFLQIAEFTGDIGISIIIVIVNILIWRAWRNPVRKQKAIMVLAAGLIIMVPTIYGAMILPDFDGGEKREISIALLQGSVDLETKWDPNKKIYNFMLYDSLSLAASEADFIVWPETAAPAYLLSNRRLTHMVSETARKAGKPMLVGTLDYVKLPDGDKYYNAAIQFDADGSYRPPYHKTKLVPFAETVPYGDYIPWLANLSLGWSDFEHGDNPQLYQNDFGSYGVLICYEVIFPEVINDYVHQGADFLVNITNDTWYGRSTGPDQHAIMAVFRAIENRIYIVRAANSGYSYFVDEYGRIYNESKLFERTIIRGNINRIKGITFFGRTGPILGQIGLLLIALISIILLSLWLKEKFNG